jgi:hypothetical protein
MRILCGCQPQKERKTAKPWYGASPAATRIRKNGCIALSSPKCHAGCRVDGRIHGISTLGNDPVGAIVAAHKFEELHNAGHSTHDCSLCWWLATNLFAGSLLLQYALLLLLESGFLLIGNFQLSKDWFQYIGIMQMIGLSKEAHGRSGIPTAPPCGFLARRVDIDSHSQGRRLFQTNRLWKVALELLNR